MRLKSGYMLAKWYQQTVLPKLLTRAMKSDEFKEIRKAVIAHASGDVLEIGSGPGFNMPLYQNIRALHCLEPLKKLIEQAHKQHIDGVFPVTFLEGVAENIPLPDRSIDTVVSTWTLCSVRDPRKVLREIKRILRQNGEFVFIDHGRSPWMTVRLMQKLITPFTKIFTGNCHHDRDIKQLLLGAGFKITKMEHPNETRRPFISNVQGTAVIHE